MTALIREIPDSFPQALVRGHPPHIDLELARAQHDDYRRQLDTAGHEIEVVPADENHPDCVFIEDTAVIVGDLAVVTRPGAPSRRGETGPVAQALMARFPTLEITAPATLDGGDVFTLGNTLYVGRSSRTNEAGISQLGAVAHEQGLTMVTIGVDGVLHLKSAVLPIGPDTVVVTPGTVEEGKLDGLEVLYEDPGERHHFSALLLGQETVLVTASAPATAEMVSGRGQVVRMIDVSQIQAADGGLTCMSILF